jgi:predicted GIY-YIG superfamily endonuclease
MFYVYILQSQKTKTYYYGFTEDLKTRLVDHNKGKVTYTQKLKPLDLIWYSAFQDKKKALDFEKYLKSGSGHAFSRKRFLT